MKQFGKFNIAFVLLMFNFFTLSLMAQEDVVQTLTFTDTVVTFDPINYEETRKIVKSEIEIHSNPQEKPFMRNCMESSIKNKEACSEQKFAEYISKFLDYPEEVKAKGIQGTCQVSFIITEDGTVTMVKVVQAVNPDLDAAAIKVIQKMNQYFSEEPWVPGYHDGKNVATKMVVPIKFAL
ncbi:MAG: energy transducer TonB [Saprospiraceae bacterium]|jgi:TonB family protein|nr:energy transducer TonB [Saprospiraceae bacterium]